MHNVNKRFILRSKNDLKYVLDIHLEDFVGVKMFTAWNNLDEKMNLHFCSVEEIKSFRKYHVSCLYHTFEDSQQLVSSAEHEDWTVRGKKKQKNSLD